MNNIDEEAIISLAASTAFLRNDWNNETTFNDVYDADGFEDIIHLTMDYCKWVGLSNYTVTADTICESVWGQTYAYLAEPLE